MKSNHMNEAKLKVLIMALKEIVDELENEIYAELETDTPAFSSPPTDYDESFEYEDNDAFPN